MKFLKNTFLLLIPVLLVFSSCEDDENSTPISNNVNFKGKIFVQNEFQQPLYDERSGIQVLAEVGFQSFPISADAVGQYQLSSAPVGTYTLTISKDGFSNIVVSNLAMSAISPNFPVEDGFQKLPTYTITKLPSTVFENLNLDLESTITGEEPDQDTLFTLTITSTMIPEPPPTGQAKGFRIFISDDPDVGPEEYIYQEHYASTAADVEVIFNSEWFDELELRSGDALFAAIYGDANFNQEIAIAEGDTLFPNITPEVGAFSSVVLP
ncbi:MAG: carboxypeptidase-like regulatory domain-containing protein [Flavobacteriales bacterium]|nr:carboxypeptidase-like regulatory domain-containing protein [Flavobacteriales bacterium]